MTTASTIDPNRLLLTGENPYIRLSETDDGPVTSDASFWRILFSPGGPGHVLFLQSELTGNEPRIYTDNIQMTRWLQGEIQGRINATFGNTEIPATEASFRSSGDLRSFWTEWVSAHGEDIALTWYDLGEPFMSHSFPGGNPERPHGVSTVLIPANGARITHKRPSRHPAGPSPGSATPASTAPARWRSRRRGRCPTSNGVHLFTLSLEGEGWGEGEIPYFGGKSDIAASREDAPTLTVPPEGEGT